MSALKDIRAALASALGAVPGLQSYEFVPGTVSVPASIVAPDSIEYETDFDGGATYRFPVQFLVALGDWESAQDELDSFVSHDGTGVLAIEGSDVEARVTGLEGYGLTTYGSTEYLGAQVVVEVIV